MSKPLSLVTGAAGFIGSNLTDYLLDLGHQVIGVDNKSADNDNFYWNDKGWNIDHDITDYKDNPDWLRDYSDPSTMPGVGEVGEWKDKLRKTKPGWNDVLRKAKSAPGSRVKTL